MQQWISQLDQDVLRDAGYISAALTAICALLCFVLPYRWGKRAAYLGATAIGVATLMICALSLSEKPTEVSQQARISLQKLISSQQLHYQRTGGYDPQLVVEAHYQPQVRVFDHKQQLDLLVELSDQQWYAIEAARGEVKEFPCHSAAGGCQDGSWAAK